MPSKVWVFLITIVALLIASGLFFLTPVFKINNVQCFLDGEENCPNELTVQLESLKDKSFFFTQLEKKVHQLELNFYQLNSLKKTWPSTIVLEFSPKPNSYFLEFGFEDKIYLITQNGLVRSLTYSQELPRIKIIDWANPLDGDRVKKDLHQLNLNLIQSLATHKIAYQQVIIYSPQEIEIILSDDLKAIIHNQDLENQIAKLAIIQQEVELKKVDLKINTIDLRFKFPVLKRTS